MRENSWSQGPQEQHTGMFSKNSKEADEAREWSMQEDSRIGQRGQIKEDQIGPCRSARLTRQLLQEEFWC